MKASIGVRYDLNTSHVILYPGAHGPGFYIPSNLNTSHVILYRPRGKNYQKK